MRVVFPADYFAVREPDAAFAEQAALFAGLGWPVSTFAFGGDRRFRPALEAGEAVLYRGWMLNVDAYRAFGDAVVGAGARLWTPLDAYLSAHHLPRWAPLLADVTAETVCFPDPGEVRAGLERLGWERYFVKDFVKSLKTGAGSVITRPEQAEELMARMMQFRGEIEGGVCVRRFEAFVDGTESRFFVRDGQAFAAGGGPVPELVRAVAGRVPSRFFSVDVALRSDGAWRVVEVGDGQVSDLVGWTVPQFAAVWEGVT